MLRENRPNLKVYRIRLQEDKEFVFEICKNIINDTLI